MHRPYFFINMNKKVYSGIGGQAVIEGIMMRNKDMYAVAVRKTNGEIVVKKDTYTMITKKYKILGLPFIRGIFSMIDSLVLGIKTLEYSASFFEDDTVESESKFEKWLDDHINEKTMGVVMGIVTVISFIFAILIFALLPAAVGSLFKKVVDDNFLVSFVEGVFRIIIFILYIKLIGRFPDIKRTFEYHGSEHKCINCIESGLDLTIPNVMNSSKEHRRCGTSFIVFIMIISIFLFMFIRTDTIYLKFLSRILLIPVVAGISYELLKLMGQFDNKLTDILSRPGMWMQGLTTYEPDSSEVEVAIKAVEAVFDWKKFKEDNF